MRSASYAVIKYIADPARNEPVNIGAVIWEGDDFRLRILPEAASRVIGDNPHLARESLLFLEPTLIDEIQGQGAVENPVKQWIEHQSGFPVLFTNPLYAAIVEETDDPLATVLDRLLDRVVRPHPRRGGGGGDNPVELIERRIDHLIARRIVHKDYPFPQSRTGVARSVNFFRNSTVNLALDVVRMDIQRAATIRERADAEANKAGDILAANGDVRFVVYCDMSRSPELTEANEDARRILESAGAAVETDMELAIYAIGP